MKEFWNQRYAIDEYAYGETPNTFFKNRIEKLKPGSILFPAEGEGRNAVYAASLGWEVTAFDTSVEGKRKADRLAQKMNVLVDYHLADFNQFNALGKQFDCIVLTFVHAPEKMRALNHKLVEQWLKPNGIIILQGFSKNQLGKSSGGPQDLSLLMSREELEADFKNLSNLTVETADVTLDEGLFHKGVASVINLVGTK